MKVNRNYKPRTKPPLERGGNIITSPDENADTFADHFANIWKGPHKKSKPVKNKKMKKEEEVPYNKPFTERGLKAAIKQQKNTAPREYTIHPQMIKRLPLIH